MFQVDAEMIMVTSQGWWCGLVM